MSADVKEALSLASAIIPSLKPKPIPPKPRERWIAQDIEATYPPNPDQPKGYTDRGTAMVTVNGAWSAADLAARLANAVQSDLDFIEAHGGTARLVGKPYQK